MIWRVRPILRGPIPLMALAFLVLTSSDSQANTAGTLYVSTNTTLSANHDGDIVVVADNVTLDCAGHVVSAHLEVGVLLQDRTNVIVKNCHVTGFVRGFQILNSSGNTLISNTANGNDFGFALAGASGNQLTNNTANSNEFAGFAPGESVANTFTGNTANLNGRNGFEVHLNSNSNVFVENVTNNNGAVGFALSTSSFNQFSGNIANGNAANGFGFSASNGNVLEDNSALRNGFAGFSLNQSEQPANQQ